MDGLSGDDISRKYKVILSNPPFGMVFPRESIRKDLHTKSKKSELLFLEMIMEALDSGGRCAIVVPEGLLLGSTVAHRQLRRRLVESFELLAVISLPSGVFEPHTALKTGVLVFQCPTESEEKVKKDKLSDKIWFYDVRADGYDPS